MRAFTKRESEIKIIPEEKSMTSGISIINVKGLRNEIANLDVVGVTWVNELGVIGSFETDTSGNGIADGIAGLDGVSSFELSTKSLFGSFSQHASGSSTGTNRVNKIYYNDYTEVSGQTFYISSLFKFGSLHDATLNRLHAQKRKGGYAGEANDTLTPSGDWQKASVCISCDETITALWGWLDCKYASGGANSIDVYEDGRMVINLTKMGLLPTALASYFGKTNFEDLTANEVDEIVPNYVHSVQTVGYSFENGEYTPEIVNKGRNLVNLTTTVDRHSYGEEWNGTVLETFGLYRGSGFVIPCKPNTTYTLSRTKIEPEHNLIAIIECSKIPETHWISDFSWRLNSESMNSEGYEISLTTTTGKFLYIISRNFPPQKYGRVDFSDLQLEEGSTATDYTPPKKDSITLPQLNGLGGAYCDLKYKRTHRETVAISSNSATASYSGTGSCVLISSSGGVIWGTISGTSISATTSNGTYTVIYKLSTPVAQNLPTQIPIYTGDNNVICEGAAISITHTKETTTNEILAFAEGIRITDSKSFHEYQPVNATGKRRIENLKGYKISIDDIFLDSGWDDRFESGKTFTLEITDDNDDETNIITTKYHGCVITSLSRTESEYIKRGVEIIAESKVINE